MLTISHFSYGLPFNLSLAWAEYEKKQNKKHYTEKILIQRKALCQLSSPAPSGCISFLERYTVVAEYIRSSRLQAQQGDNL